MKALLINPPYQTITSNVGVGHQVPLGLLMVGGALIDAGHEVRLLDAEMKRLSDREIVAEVLAYRPDLVLTGHAGSTPAHPICMRTLTSVKRAAPQIVAVYGGVYPTYHARRILSEADCPVDFVVCGEGEETIVELAGALGELIDPCGTAQRQLLAMTNLVSTKGIAYRGASGDVIVTDRRMPIANLDRFRTGWELIADRDWDRYQCFGLGRAAIVQFSRGCPHRCTYCGQHGFWVSWRHRNVKKLVDEIEWLCREKGVRFVTLADENPTTLRPSWSSFLRELAARNLPVRFFATIRATDIVRDREMLPLWRQAGLLYVLMGLDATDEATIQRIKKGSCRRIDFEACRLLKQHGIVSILGHVVGLADDDKSSLRLAGRQLDLYDGDFLNAMYATPHDWTQFGEEMRGRQTEQPDQTKWDYRHQVLSNPRLSPVRLFLEVKRLELRFHLKLAKLFRMLFHRDRFLRSQYRWTLRRSAGVFCAEIAEFLFDRLRSLLGKRSSIVFQPAVDNRRPKPAIEDGAVKLNSQTKPQPGLVN